MIGMSRGDEEIIDSALDMLVWQRKRIAALEVETAALREIIARLTGNADDPLAT